MSSSSWSQYIFLRLLIVVCGLAALFMMFLSFLRHPILFFKRTKRVSPPDCMLDPTLGKHQYVKANGINFHYVTNGDPAKPLMLLLHGFPEFWYSWRHQLKAFSGDYHVVAVDMRGYNETERPPSRQDYTLSKLSQDVVQLIPALGHDKAILVAHDWGAAIAWVTAHTHPELVEKLVIMNCPHPKMMRKWALNHSSQLKKSLYTLLFQLPWLPELLMSMNDYESMKRSFRSRFCGVRKRHAFTAEDVEAYKYVFSQKGALTYPLNYYRANVLRSDISYSGKVTVPTVIIWGDKDAFFDVGVADSHSEIVEDLTIHHLDDCSHWVQNDDPEQANQLVKDFLDRDSK